MKTRLFKTARATALASLLAMQGPLVLRAQATPGTPEGSALAAFNIEKFWQEAWGSEFLPQKSGLLLQGRAAGIFGVQVFDGEQVVAEGTWFEVLRLEVPQLDGLAQLEGASDLFSITHAVTAGLLLGSTGSTSPVLGLDVTVSYQGPDGKTVVESFTPWGLAGDVESAVQGAIDLQANLEGAAPVLAGRDDVALDPCYCEQRYANDRAACRFSYVQCQATCLGAAIIAITACLALGPFAPACQAAALAAYAACLAACLASELACLRQAANKFLQCAVDCARSPGIPRPTPRW